MVIIPFHYHSPSPSKDDQFVVLHTLEITVQVLRTVQTQNGCFWAHPPSPTVNNQFYRVDRYVLTWPNQITADSIKVLHFFSLTTLSLQRNRFIWWFAQEHWSLNYNDSISTSWWGLRNPAQLIRARSRVTTSVFTNISRVGTNVLTIVFPSGVIIEKRPLWIRCLLFPLIAFIPPSSTFNDDTQFRWRVLSGFFPMTKHHFNNHSCNIWT